MDAQLERHLEALHGDGHGAKVLVALTNFETLSADRFNRIEAVCAEKYQGKIYFAALSFEDFFEAVQKQRVSKNLADALSDFEAYLDESGLRSALEASPRCRELQRPTVRNH